VQGATKSERPSCFSLALDNPEIRVALSLPDERTRVCATPHFGQNRSRFSLRGRRDSPGNDGRLGALLKQREFAIKAPPIGRDNDYYSLMDLRACLNEIDPWAVKSSAAPRSAVWAPEVL
jgi:hypothetical protein